MFFSKKFVLGCLWIVTMNVHAYVVCPSSIICTKDSDRSSCNIYPDEWHWSGGGAPIKKGVYFFDSAYVQSAEDPGGLLTYGSCRYTSKPDEKGTSRRITIFSNYPYLKPVIEASFLWKKYEGTRYSCESSIAYLCPLDN